MNATQRSGVLKWSLLVIILSAIIVFFNVGEEEIIDESITPEDVELKTQSKNIYHLLRPKTKAWVDDALSIEKEEVVQDLAADSQGENDDSLTKHQSETADGNANTIDNNVIEEKDEENGAEEPSEEVTEVVDVESTQEKVVENLPQVDDEATGDETLVQSTLDQNEQTTTGPEISTEGAFTLERLKATREAAQKLVSMLEEYYNGVEQSKNMMLDSWLLPWDFDPESKDDPDKVIMKDKIVDTIARALVTSDQKEFIIGTIGSSVAAGHDNCNYDSYERQMERTFGPVWEAAGMKLVCQNAGEGGGCGDDFANQVFCIKQNVSPNIDVAQ